MLVTRPGKGHLLGPARSLGGVIVGYLGVRVFTPQPVSKMIETVGGCHVLLGIIAMANDMESLYAGVKSLVCVLKSNPFAHYEMEGLKGYQTLGMLLRRKLPLLNAHILHLMFTMAGTLDVSATSVILTSTNKVWPLNSQLCFSPIKCFLVILDNGQMSLLFSKPKGAVSLELNRR